MAAVFLLESLMLLVSVLSMLNDFILVVLWEVSLFDVQERRCFRASCICNSSKVISLIYSNYASSRIFIDSDLVFLLGGDVDDRVDPDGGPVEDVGD